MGRDSLNRLQTNWLVPLLALVLLIPLVLFAWPRCTKMGANEQKNKQQHTNLGRQLDVVATTTIVGDVVKQVAGQRASVTVLLPYGVDPHAWTPTPDALAAMEKADILFINGIGLEDGFLTGLIEQSGSKADIVSVSNGIRPRHFQEMASSRELAAVPQRMKAVTEGGRADSLLGTGHAHAAPIQAEEPDPHVWMNPHNVMVWAANIQEALGKHDVSNGPYFAEKANWYKTKLIELDGRLTRTLEAVPPLKRRLVTDHLFLGYFADRYGFTQVGALLPGSTTLGEPSPKDLARLEEIVRRMKVPAIFGAKGLNNQLAARLSDDLNTDLRLLYTGSLTEPGGEAGNYLEYMTYNVQQITEGLNPPRTMNRESAAPGELP